MPERLSMVRRGLHLSIFTVAWNVLEGIVAVTAGFFSGSVALLGFGIDSFVESVSGIVVGWRFSYEMGGRSQEQTEKVEKRAAFLTGILLLILAVYLLIESCRRLFGFGREPGPSLPGIVLTILSLVIMPILARAKLRIASSLGSRAMRADSYETIACAWLSATTLAGLILNAALHWWWADPVAALVLVPLIAHEGIEGVHGEAD